MKRWLIYFILILQCFLTAYAAAAPQIPPRPSAADGIYAQDYAHVLSEADKKQLLNLGQELDNKTTAQLAVITIDTLGGQSIEDYSLAVLRQWGIGSREKNNGALIVVAVRDRRSRIEVGYGLEGVINDGLAGRIQDQYMLPYFRKGDYAAGIVSGYANTAALIAKSANIKLDGLTSYQGGAQQRTDSDDSYPLWLKLLIGAGIVIVLIIDNLFLGGFITQMLFFMFLRGRGGGRGGFGGGSGGGGGSSRSW